MHKCKMLCDTYVGLFVDDVETVLPRKTDQLKMELDQYLNVCFYYVYIKVPLRVCA